ncbi:hypothetical protein ACFLQY_04205 [Verrucomicrobiota bacterium]
MSNLYLERAFMQAAILCKRADPKLNAYSKRLARKREHAANAIMASKIARAGCKVGVTYIRALQYEDGRK